MFLIRIYIARIIPRVARVLSETVAPELRDEDRRR